MNNFTNKSKSVNSNELQDQVFIFKVLNYPKLSEYIKRIEKVEIIRPLKEFCKDELKVLFLYAFCC